MKLVFVYNTDGDPVSSLIDFGHKIISPETYDCSLCKLTHGPFAEAGQWRDFRTSVGIPMEFLHRDEFEKKYQQRFEYPVILKKNETFEVVLSKKDIDSIPDLNGLIAAVSSRISRKG
jgi:hypothetical protein